MRERGARIGDGDISDARRQRRRRALGDDHAGAVLDRLRDKGETILLGAGERKEDIAGLRLATVGAQARDLARRQARASRRAGR